MERLSLYKRVSFAVLLSILSISAHGQLHISKNEIILKEDSVKKDYSGQPYFGLYKDNYFVFGPTIGHKPTRENTNVKFQISIAQRLTKAVLPFGTYIYLFYTQKCFQNVLEKSLPMTDLNFNPGIGISKPLFKDNRYIGKATFIIEHESNGRDSIWSRSWNRIALSANLMITNNIMAHGKIWMPIVDGENNKNIVRYCGFSQFGMQYLTENRRFVSGITVTLRHKFGSFNITAGFGYRIFKSDNQFIYAQYYNGYGEGMLDYNKFHSQLRVGLLIRPKFFSDF